jgi:hypothetical protein
VGHARGCRAGNASPPRAELNLDAEVQLHASWVLCSTITHPSRLRRASMSTARRSFARRSIWIEIVGGRPQDRERLSTLRDRGRGDAQRCREPRRATPANSLAKRRHNDRAG